MRSFLQPVSAGSETISRKSPRVNRLTIPILASRNVRIARTAAAPARADRRQRARHPARLPGPLGRVVCAIARAGPGTAVGGSVQAPGQTGRRLAKGDRSSPSRSSSPWRSMTPGGRVEPPKRTIPDSVRGQAQVGSNGPN
jgi:hypothetical protein